MIAGMIFAMVSWFCVYRKTFAAKDRFIFTDRFMKSLTLKLAALLMVYIYIVGIAGLDVHSCRASGKDYVVAAITGVAGLDCEDIHPESHGHHCTHGQDSNHEHHCTHGQRVCECEVEVNDCCSNTYHALTISGSGDGQRIAINHFHAPVSIHIHCCLCCKDCRLASTGMLNERGLLTGAPIDGYDFRGKLFSVFRI